MPHRIALIYALAFSTMIHAVAVAIDDLDAPGRVSIVEKVGLDCDDCDGVALGDISGNGSIDILASNGKGGSAFWFEQGSHWRAWTRHAIFTIAEEGREIEGNDLADFDGDGRLEAISLDQRNGAVYLHKMGEDPRAPWPTAAIQRDRPFIQATLVMEVRGAGRPALVYSWEGNAPGTGGVHWLEFTGDDLLDPSHWTDHVMAQHESAWWLAPRPADLNGNGRATDIAFSARNILGRNAGARPGLYWLEEPEDVTGAWKVHTIDTELNHPLHIDFGDFSGDGNGLDIVIGGFQTQAVHWYRFANDWSRHTLALPETVNGVAPDRVWNVKSLPMPEGRDAILSPVTGERRGEVLLFQCVHGEYRPHILETFDYGHPMDDRIILHDFTGDGRPEAVIPDSGPGVNKLWIVRFDWR